MPSEEDPPPRYSDPGERISLTDLEEIKPLGTTPPPVPNEAAEHFDLDEAMSRALSSVAAPPAPTIDVERRSTPDKKPTQSKNLRPVQAAVAITIGAAIAWFVQRPAEPTESVAQNDPPAETSTNIAQVRPENDAPSIPEMAAAEPISSVMSEPGAMPTGPTPTEPIVAQRPEAADEPQADEPQNEHAAEPTVAAHHAEAQQAQHSTSPTQAAEAESDDNPHLPADYDTPEAQAAREAHRQEVREAEAAAQAAREAEAAAEAARAELPPEPDRDSVRDAMEAVRGAITQCAGGAHGTATMRITVHHSGRVQGALVEGTFAGTPEGSCMALAARRARFPAFSNDRFAVTYPFTF